MTSDELKERLKEAKKNGFWECRFDRKLLDHEYAFNEELACGFQIEKIDYPANDKDEKCSHPRARFKFSEAMEELWRLKIEYQQEIERHSERLKKIQSNIMALRKEIK